MPLPIISASYRPSGNPPPFANHTSRVLAGAAIIAVGRQKPTMSEPLRSCERLPARDRAAALGR